jgi:hypothetical protein
MSKRKSILVPVTALMIASVVWAFAIARTEARAEADKAAAQTAANRVKVGADNIGGVVTSSKGPEAGVWVIAETTDTQTKFRKIVVTDERGRYLLPDLPMANYKIWVRGYGLVDSKPVESTPEKRVALTAVIAPNARAAAQYYPADYWYSLINVPSKENFPGTGPQGNGIAVTMKTQAQWLQQMKTGCEVCHQLGDKATRELEPSLGQFDSPSLAWDHRVQVGQDGAGMTATMNTFGRDRALAMYADWTNRIAAGEVPQAPPRPQGVERNVVLTLWEWGGPASFVHDEVSTDWRHPTANAYGPIYGADWGNDGFLIIDPVKNTASETRIPLADPSVPPNKDQTMPQPSPYWGKELYWNDPADPAAMAMDKKGRVWISARSRRNENQPAYCKEGSDNPYAKNYPISENRRELAVYDPKTKTFKLVNTCFEAHHVVFADDKDETVYVDGIGSGTIGWVKTRVLDETGDEQAAQGWCGGYFDINGNGKYDEGIDKKINMRGVYSVAPNPVDGSVWGARAGVPGQMFRIDPKTCATEVYEPPFQNPKAPAGVVAFSPRGIDVDSKGIVWSALGSGHMASFDRSKCAVLTGEAATDGQHCPEGWTFYPSPGPRFKSGVTDNIAVDHHYYNWVDKFNTLGLGNDIPVADGTGSDSLLALIPSTGKWVVLRVPYPMGFYQRGMDGRIDDPNAGWKGRAMYADYGPNAIWHSEGGKGTKGNLVKFQLRPNPLAN